ncbi:hypothetical protein GCM10023333_43070 [Ferrimonas pelagia]|uniref:PEGA domain-containing protein n=2 Tax=Ferrimonas pelagia TaxID=1177826 RepID=A0ABP9FSY0_9GAMM
MAHELSLQERETPQVMDHQHDVLEQRTAVLERSLSRASSQWLTLQQQVADSGEQIAQQNTVIEQLRGQLAALEQQTLLQRAEVESVELVDLFVETQPANAKVEVLNIKPRYTQGLSLPEGQYLLRISAPGYMTLNRWVKLQHLNNRYCVNLLGDASPLESPTPGEHQSAIFEAPCIW